jgi:hypothetical protein
MKTEKILYIFEDDFFNKEKQKKEEEEEVKTVIARFNPNSVWQHI